jgi:hypothetical protein
MKKILFLLTLLPLVISAKKNKGPFGYWQQHADYTITVDMDVKNHQYKGYQKLIYTNNSPDTLTSVFYHLYFNAFQPESMMDIRSRTIADPDSRVMDRISKLSPTEIGFQKINWLKRDGKEIKFVMEGTILEVKLDKPILPGKKAIFEMDFLAQVPVQIRRSGRHNAEGIDYSMTQWYPKMCEYDIEGWHSNPYIGREFHGIWGNFDVKISIDKNYTLGGTGYLQNPQEIGKGYEDPTKPITPTTGEKLTWHFKAPNVHDFAWAADPDFVHDKINLDNGTVIHFIYQKDSLEANWKKLAPLTKKGFEYMNKTFGEYPYQQYSVIQGGDGGMEYPMCTLITAEGSFAGLLSVTIHEAAHSWFQGLLGTNEAKYAWMDEGFTTFAQYKTIEHINDKSTINPLIRSYGGYIKLANSDRQEPLTTHADFYISNGVYGNNVYNKGAVFLMQLGYVIGDATMMKGMLRYFNEWKFKHPTPLALKRIMEKESGLELDWYWEQFVETTNKIDYGIKSVTANGSKTMIELERIGTMPMPIDVVVKKKDGTLTWYYIPLTIMRGIKQNDIYEITRLNMQGWPWVVPAYGFEIPTALDQIENIVIDPSTRLADVNQADNVYPKKVIEEKKEK